MIRQILGWLIAAIIVIAIIAWILSGGLGRAITYARSLTDAGSYLSLNATSSGQEFRLPGQPDFSNTVGNTLQTDTGYVDNYVTPDYGSIPPVDAGPTSPPDAPGLRGEQDPRTFGSPSPYAGHVTFVGHNTTGNVRTEYVVVQAAPGNSAAVSLAGWTIQSALTTVRVALPQASNLFVQGVLNTSSAPILEPGAAAVVASGISPVGVSFHLNRCSGYLAQLEQFTPTLSSACPAGAEIPIAQGADAECFSYLNSLPSCRFPGGPAAQNPGVPENCRRLASEVLSYNGCVSTFKNSPGFALPEWRLYLTLSAPVWKPTHDTIRLLDNAGRVVDVLSY